MRLTRGTTGSVDCTQADSEIARVAVVDLAELDIRDGRPHREGPAHDIQLSAVQGVLESALLSIEAQRGVRPGEGPPRSIVPVGFEEYVRLWIVRHDCAGGTEGTRCSRRFAIRACVPTIAILPAVANLTHVVFFGSGSGIQRIGFTDSVFHNLRWHRSGWLGNDLDHRGTLAAFDDPFSCR